MSVSADSIILTVSDIDTFQVAVVSDGGHLLDLIWNYDNTFSYSKPVENCFFAINGHNVVPYVIRYDIYSDYIQNTIFDYDAYYMKGGINIGYDVTSSQGQGKVIVKTGKHLELEKGTGINIKNGFTIEKGATFIIK